MLRLPPSWWPGNTCAYRMHAADQRNRLHLGFMFRSLVFSYPGTLIPGGPEYKWPEGTPAHGECMLQIYNSTPAPLIPWGF